MRRFDAAADKTPRRAPIYFARSVTNLGAMMGKGDLRTRRGKIYNGSFGKKRPGRAPKKAVEPARPAHGGRK
jgi:30S ribosomal protein S31